MITDGSFYNFVLLFNNEENVTEKFTPFINIKIKWKDEAFTFIMSRQDLKILVNQGVGL